MTAAAPLMAWEVSYTAHVRNQGWQSAKSDGETAGTTGEGLQMEAITMTLTGTKADQYDICYRVHVSGIGWMSWARNGEIAGTTGFSLPVEAMQVVIVAKGAAAPTANPASDTEKSYQNSEKIKLAGHIQDIGWGQGEQTADQRNTATVGTTGQALRLEAVPPDQRR